MDPEQEAEINPEADLVEVDFEEAITEFKLLCEDHHPASEQEKKSAGVADSAYPSCMVPSIKTPLDALPVTQLTSSAPDVLIAVPKNEVLLERNQISLSASI